MELKFDISALQRAAHRLAVARDQVPYAMARALNDAAFDARNKLVHSTWPQHVTVRQPNFPSAVLHVQKADRHNLTVTIAEKPSTVSLTRHAEGGTKTPQRARHLAIPLKSWVRYGTRGVRADMLPRSIIANTPKRALRITSKGIFVGEGGRLHLRYSLKSNAAQPKDVPFYQDFAQSMRDKVIGLLPRYLIEAMARRGST